MKRTMSLSLLDKNDILDRVAAFDASEWIPSSCRDVGDSQKEIPRIAKDASLTAEIERILPRIPTRHDIFVGDARKMQFIKPDSVHLVLTSPPYWTLKKYQDHAAQLGSVEGYAEFLFELEKVWNICHHVLVPGGRLVCVVGDVCLSRRKNQGEHTVVPLHASIQEQCRAIGFSNLSPIIWNKIANASHEAEGNGGGFLGKPYEPNSVIKNDIEFILMERKQGGYRSPSLSARILSVIPADKHKIWFQQIWTGVTGASTRLHPAPFPTELAERLIRMFSFVGDTVLDPFMGTGTTSAAAGRLGRNSLGVEIDAGYFDIAARRIHEALGKYGTGVVIPHTSGACTGWDSISGKNSARPSATSGACEKANTKAKEEGLEKRTPEIVPL